MIKIICTDSLQKVLTDVQPKEKTIYSRAFLGEVYSCQFAFFADEEEEVSFSVYDNDQPFDNVYRVKEVPGLVNKYLDCDDYVIYSDRNDTYYPDVLIPISEKVKLRKDKWLCLRCVFDCAEKSVGRHTVKIAARGKNSTAECSTEFEIIGEKLPALDIPNTAWFHYDSLSDITGKKVYGEEYNKIMYRYFENEISHDLNCLYIPMFSFATNVNVGKYRKNIQLVDVSVKGEDDYEFSFVRLIDFMKKAESFGFKYFEMGHLATQWGAEFCPPIYVKVNGRQKRIFGWKVKSNSPKYFAFLDKFLPLLVAELNKNGYAGRCFFHVSDEPRPEHKYYPIISSHIKKLIGDYKTFDALSSYEFYDKKYVDVPVVETKETAPFIENKVNYWLYYCCQHCVNNFSNRFFNMPLERTRILGIQAYLNGVKGFLHWGYNFYYTSMSEKLINPYVVTDAGGKFPAGDSYVVYPGKNGEVYDSIRHEAFREAWQDYRALKLLESKVGRNFVVELIKAEGVSGFDVYPHSSDWLLSFREKINSLITENKYDKLNG